MTFVLLAVVVALVAAVAAYARPRYALGNKVVREASARMRPIVQAQLAAREPPETCYAYEYHYAGNDGDHDNKIVVRVDVANGKLVTRLAPVDRSGKRIGDSRIVLTR